MDPSLAGIAAIITALGIAVPAILIAINSYKAAAHLRELKADFAIAKSDVSEVKETVKIVQHDMKTLELNTNSIKDALIASEKTTSEQIGFIKGTEAERANPMVPK